MNDSGRATYVVRTLAEATFLLGATNLSGWTAAAGPTGQVLFVCEHGNVKSVMAAAYFNRLAAERNLPLRAVSRGATPEPASVPSAIVAALRTEGIDVSRVRPLALSPRDASESEHVVSIGPELPRALRGTGAEQWSDVPAASTNYAAARESLRAHVRDLLERLSRSASQ